jgi:hypothetical protein
MAVVCSTASHTNAAIYAPERLNGCTDGDVGHSELDDVCSPSEAATEGGGYD